MRHFLFPGLLLIALLSACSTPQSRIDSNRAAFDQFPAAVQEKIRAGRVDLGFTPEMVRMALGKPARQTTRKTTAGDVEIWIYTDDKPQLSFGFGVASGGYHHAMGVGMETSTGGYDPDEKARVEFRGGQVVSVEYRKG